MTKLLAVVKREYTQRVKARMFIVTTVLLPFAMALFGIAPALVLSIEAGSPLRIVVSDGTGKLFPRLQSALQVQEKTSTEEIDPMRKNNALEKAREQNFFLEELSAAGRSETDINTELERRLRAKEIDAYLILPA